MIRTSRFVPAFLASVLVLAAQPARGEEAEAIPWRQDVPPNPPRSAEEALEHMVVPDGFSVEIVAREPDIVNPVAMSFDDRGRIWVAESIEYPRKTPGPGRDRVQVLEDTDGDGRADRFGVFVDGLNIPTGVALGHGGVWVLNAPDLLFFTDEGGKAGRREVVVSGFGRADTHELPNSLTWGPDGWLYGLNGVFNPSRIVSGGKTHEFTCALWRVHPRTREFRVVCEGTSNPWGIAWDLDGSAIVSACHWANDHLFHFVETGYYKRQAGAYPPYSVRLGSISTHSHQKTAYCGLAFYDAHAYPQAYRERFYLGNVHGGAINVDFVRRDGATYVSSAEPDFLAANDAWFLPVAQKVGPDGCLYILDWYDRYHCYQDANRDAPGIDRLRGRLYRVRYGNAPRPRSLDLAREPDGKLIETLADPNIHLRETAQRILAERAAPEAGKRLEALVLDGATPSKQRMHALWTLLGAASLEPAFHLAALAHTDPRVRAWAVRAAGDACAVAPEVRTRVESHVRDPAPGVLLELAIASRKIEGLDGIRILFDVLGSSGEDKLIPPIVWQNLHPLLESGAGRFARIAADTDLSRARTLGAMLPLAVDRALGARQVDDAAVASMVTQLAGAAPAEAREALSAVARRWDELDGAARAALRDRLEPMTREVLARQSSDPLRPSALLLAARLGAEGADPSAVRARLLDRDEPDSSRLDALEALVAFRFPDLPEAAAEVLEGASPAFAAKVLASLGQSENPALADRIIAVYPRLAPETQPIAVDLLLQREPWMRRLLDAVVAKRLPSGVLHANHIRKVLEMNDREAIWLVERTWGRVREERSPEQEKLVAAMAEAIRTTSGDPVAGEGVFRKLCAQCHAIYGDGKTVGPDLTGNGRASFDQLLSNVFDPSLVIGPGYGVFTVVTTDGRNLTGLLVEDGEQRVVVRMAGGEEASVPRRGVKYVRASKLSMMPEGIEKLFDRKEIADLFAFLSLDKHPGDPSARPISGAPGWLGEWAARSGASGEAGRGANAGR